MLKSKVDQAEVVVELYKMKLNEEISSREKTEARFLSAEEEHASLEDSLVHLLERRVTSQASLEKKCNQLHLRSLVSDTKHAKLVLELECSKKELAEMEGRLQESAGRVGDLESMNRDLERENKYLGDNNAFLQKELEFSRQEGDKAAVLAEAELVKVQANADSLRAETEQLKKELELLKEQNKLKGDTFLGIRDLMDKMDKAGSEVWEK